MELNKTNHDVVKVLFSDEILRYFESIKTDKNNIWINKYFEILSDTSNVVSKKYNIHHIRPCFTFKSNKHRSRKETKVIGDNFPGNLIKLSIYNHLLAHYYLWKIYDDADSKISFQMMCGERGKYINNLTENELKEICSLKECVAVDNIVKDKQEYMKEYRESHRKDIKESTNAYYELHHQEILEYAKQYRNENHEQVLEYAKQYNKQYYKNNSDKIKNNVKSYQLNNIEKYNQSHKKSNTKYRDKNREKVTKQQKEYDSRKCFDPIKKDVCTYNALKTRKYRNESLYKDINPNGCIIA